MSDYNPFAGLGVVTPESLKAQRYAQDAEQTKGLDYWVQAGSRAGLDFRNALLDQGKGMTPEDQRAARNQSIMEKASKSIAEMSKDKSMDPYDVQELAVNQAMQDFMNIGDYQSAQSLIPSLNQIRTYRAEVDKLKSEAGKNDAAARSSDSTASLNAAKEGRIPFQNTLDEEKAATEKAKQDFNYAGARMRDRMPVIKPGKDGTGGLELPPLQQVNFAKQFSGTLNLFDRMDDLSLYMDNAARAASPQAQGINVANQWLKGMSTMFESKGASVGGPTNLSTNASDGANGVSPAEMFARRHKEMRAHARTLGMDVTAYESLVIDAAYALARANDPGGRLSNNDFDYALKSLGAVTDPASAKAAFASIAERAYDNMKNNMKGLGKSTSDRYFSEQMRDLEDRYAEYKGRWGTTPIRDTAPRSEPAGGQRRSGSVVADRPADIQAMFDARKPK